MRKFVMLVAALIGLGFFAPSASATVIASTLGSGSYLNGGLGFGGSTGYWGRSLSFAVGFTSAINASLDQIDLGLSHWTGVNSARVSLWTSDGSAPDVMLASWDVSGFPQIGSSRTALVTISGISGVTLQSGVEYFLMVGPANADDNSRSDWNYNNAGIVGEPLNNYNGGWQPQHRALPAFDVIGHLDTRIPEPATIALVLVGAAGVLRLRGRKGGKQPPQERN